MYFFVPERILIIGEVSKMEEIPFAPAPFIVDNNLPYGVMYDVIDFDDNFNLKTGVVLSEADSYADYLHVVVSESEKEICIKVSHEFYLETEKRFNQNDKSFSYSCYKYGYDSILRLIEPEKQQIPAVT
jgi:hypothetical protein